MNGQPIRLLLIEDNPGDARLLSEMLRDAQAIRFELMWADHLANGLERLRAGGVDVVLVDLSLPDASGMDTIVQTRQQAPDLPIIVLTASSSDEKAIAALRAGAQDYLVKGWADSELIIRTVRYAIERKRTEAELARYARELRARNEQIQADLLLAREVQMALLPQRYPVFPPGITPEQSLLRFYHHYQPATLLAGDFFDVFPISDTAAGVFICDVMGHGVRASLITAMIRPLVDELFYKAADPGSLLAEINRELVTILHQANTTIFATVFYMVADAARHELRYANAGHPSPLQLQRRRNTVTPVCLNAQHGPALGLFPDSIYPTIQHPIEPGDAMLLFTDGIFELANANGDEYGKERLEEVVRQHLALPMPELFGELLRDTKQFAGAEEFSDDVCLLSVEMK
ncbi:MAG: fused response regulator/phosphatase [Verrucomicrobia bacterium]|nr:fused response regulator/phosphatase [Verrucomicrobiota bacterium]